MRWSALAMIVAVLGAACGETDGSHTDTATTIPTVVTGVTASVVDEHDAAFVPWHERATFDPVGQDPADCLSRPDVATDEEDPGLPAAANSWLIIEGRPQLVDDDAGTRVPTGSGVTVLHPDAAFAPTQLVASTDAVRDTLIWLQTQPVVTRVAVLFRADAAVEPEPIEDERLGEIVTGWAVVGTELVSFTDCASVRWLRTILADARIGDPSTEAEFVEALTAMTANRHRVLDAMQVGGTSFRFDQCPPEDPGLIPRPGFGGADMAFAWGDELAETGGILDLSDWTVFTAPEHSPTLDVAIPPVRDWPGEQWFVTYDATDPDAVAVALFGVDDELGLFADTALTERWENICDIARDVLAFDEFRRGVEPDRERWDLPDGEEGDEQVIIDTLSALRDDETAREAFLEFTPCTYKLCVLTGGVPPRIATE